MIPDHNELVQHMKRLLEVIDNKTTTLADEVLELPTALYGDPDYWRRETDELFRRQPVMLAMSCEVPKANSYVALEEVPGFRILITRDDEGNPHAFYNSCRHRGTPVARGSKQAGRFTCPYHGWTYNTRGDLIGLSESATFGRELCKELGLIEIPVAERHGLIFGVLDPDGDIDLDGWLGDYGKELEQIGLEEMTPMWTQSFPGPNWKICKDGFIENYHFASVHSKSLPTLMGNVNVTDTWDIHGRILMPHKVINERRKLPEDQWDPVTTFETVYVLFPNTMIASAWGDWPLVTRIFPGLNPDESTCVQTLLCRLPYTPELQAEADSFKDLYKSVTQDEDYVLDYSIQHSLEGSPARKFMLGRNECAVQHFHKSIAQFVRL